MNTIEAVLYLALLHEVGEEIVKISIPAEYSSNENILKSKSEIESCLFAHRELQRKISSIKVSPEIIFEHRNLLSAYNDLVDGIEMILNSFQGAIDDTQNFDPALYIAGHGKQKLSIERTQVALNKIIERLKKLGLI